MLEFYKRGLVFDLRRDILQGGLDYLQIGNEEF